MTRQQLIEHWACTRTDLDEDRYISTEFGAVSTPEYAQLLMALSLGHTRRQQHVRVEVAAQPTRRDVKDRAYQLDRECWASYSGKPRAHKQHMDARRTVAMSRAMHELGLTAYPPH